MDIPLKRTVSFKERWVTNVKKKKKKRNFYYRQNQSQIFRSINFVKQLFGSLINYWSPLEIQTCLVDIRCKLLKIKNDFLRKVS